MAKLMYMPRMKRLQICIDQYLDDRLALEAHRRKTSKAALIREYVAEHHGGPPGPIEDDPLWEIVGMSKGHPDDSQSVDDVVYGPRE